MPPAKTRFSARHVVESRYVDNTMEKHDANPGNGTETDNKIKNFYQKVQDVKLDALLQKNMSEYGIVVGEKKWQASYTA